MCVSSFSNVFIYNLTPAFVALCVLGHLNQCVWQEVNTLQSMIIQWKLDLLECLFWQRLLANPKSIFPFFITSWDQNKEQELVVRDERVIYRFLMNRGRGTRGDALRRTNHSPSSWWLKSEQTGRQRKKRKGGYYFRHLHLLTLLLRNMVQVSPNWTRLTWGQRVSQKLQ